MFVYLLLNVPVTNFSVMSEHFLLFLGWTCSTKQRMKCLAKWHKAVSPVSFQLPPFDLESNTLPLSHCAPQCSLSQPYMHCNDARGHWYHYRILPSMLTLKTSITHPDETDHDMQSRNSETSQLTPIKSSNSSSHQLVFLEGKSFE